MRIFFDTSVLVSAFSTRGLCADLFRFVIVEHELVVGEVVLGELRRVLRDRMKAPMEAISDIEAMLREHTVVPKPPRQLGLGLADQDDEWVVASAVKGRADLLVTGDAGILELHAPPLPIVNPRGLWERLRSPPAGS